MPSSSQSLPDTPTLPNTHSGIPTRLLDKAKRAKALIWQGRKVSASQVPRTEPALPQGVSRSTFVKAISDITQTLGAENVELNDKPAVDHGWYMEHPNTHDMMTVTDPEAFLHRGSPSHRPLGQQIPHAAFIPITYFFYPETANRTLEDIDRFFETRPGVLIFNNKLATQLERPQVYIEQDEQFALHAEKGDGWSGDKGKAANEVSIEKMA
ncbi:hypothetical protein LTR91_025667 [Friedmanniomyces endolithicus]|uniref:Uncharacterized protein n=1 Tax=Friedmanniomyces endolithicus TaxID=329885 RepID=A0AAN6JWC8_9PEZI|nr:hypothetical protein LTR91_025667 [Friedmanniomyces endolithicus]KAK1025891.1 hypothetical protein LTS16_022831 [Friedmanniomyces endolithicus]